MAEQIIFHFKKSGLLTLVVDTGRPGFQAFGIPPGGALDRRAAQIANWLVGNSLDDAVLEITITGPKITIEGDCQIAITGGDISAKVNDQTINRHETISIRGGDVLSFGKLMEGCRTYCAIGGTIDMDEWMGSKSAVMPNADILTPGSIIKKGKHLLINKRRKEVIRKTPAEFQPVYSGSAIVRVIKGPEYENFRGKEYEAFWNTRHTISSESNRMGYRLETPIDMNNGYRDEIISSGIVPGTIQITKSGQAIILLADAQTIGGYHRIANVIDVDLDRLAQLKPGDFISFTRIKLKEAHKLLEENQEILSNFMA